MDLASKFTDEISALDAQGTWTPKFNVSSSDITYQIQEGWWSKTSTTVNIGGYIKIQTVTTSSTDGVTLQGIPYDVSSNAEEGYSSGNCIKIGDTADYIYADYSSSPNEIIFLRTTKADLQNGDEFVFQLTYLTKDFPQLERQVLVLSGGDVLVINSNRTLTL